MMSKRIETNLFLKKQVLNILQELLGEKGRKADDQDAINTFVMRKLPQSINEFHRVYPDEPLSESYLVLSIKKILESYCQTIYESQLQSVSDVLKHELKNLHKYNIHPNSLDLVDDIKQHIKLDLYDHYCVKLRKYTVANTKSFLRTIISNSIIDYRRKYLDKRAHTSTSAKRLGKTAESLEKMLSRGMKLDRAIELIQTEERSLGLPVSDKKKLYQLAIQIKPKLRKQLVELESLLEPLSSPCSSPEEYTINQELQLQKKKLRLVIKSIRKNLNQTEQEIFSFVFESGMSISNVARLMDLSRYQIDKILNAVLNKLRHAIEKENISEEVVNDIIEMRDESEAKN